jgi:hypothetical protein
MSAVTDADDPTRAFKTARFAKAAREARIKCDRICNDLKEIRHGDEKEV